MKPLTLGGVLGYKWRGDRERPILRGLARTIVAEKTESCVIEVWVL